MTAHNVSVPRSQSGGSRLWLGVFLAAVLVWLVLGRGVVSFIGGGESEPAPAAVSGESELAVRDNVFEPAAIEAPAGTTVTWRWEGATSHNVVGDGFESPVQESGTFSYAFAEPGRYDYQCTLHSGMRGEVVVTEA